MQSDNPTRSNPTQKNLGSKIPTFTLDCDFANSMCMNLVQKIH